MSSAAVYSGLIRARVDDASRSRGAKGWKDFFFEVAPPYLHQYESDPARSGTQAKLVHSLLVSDVKRVAFTAPDSLELFSSKADSADDERLVLAFRDNTHLKAWFRVLQRICTQVTSWPDDVPLSDEERAHVTFEDAHREAQARVADLEQQVKVAQQKAEKLSKEAAEAKGASPAAGGASGAKPAPATTSPSSGPSKAAKPAGASSGDSSPAPSAAKGGFSIKKHRQTASQVELLPLGTQPDAAGGAIDEDKEEDPSSWKVLLGPGGPLKPNPEFFPDENDPHAYLIQAPLGPKPDSGFDWATFSDLMLFVSLLAAGFAIMGGEDALNQEAIGEMLFNAGLTPFVLTFWALMTGTVMFRLQNIIKAATSFFLTAVGAYLILTNEDEPFDPANPPSEEDTTLIKIVAPVLLEIGALFFISHLFFLGEDAERQIERLEDQLKDAQAAVGAGMALSYFYNFLKVLCADLTHFEGDPSFFMKFDEGFGAAKTVHQRRLQHAKLIVLIPRQLNARDLKGVARALKAPMGTPSQKKHAHRYMGVPLLWRETEDDAEACDGIINFPTIISSVFDRYKDVEKKIEESLNPDDILPVDMPRELMDFQNHLVDLIQQYEETRDVVYVISVPELPDMGPPSDPELQQKLRDVRENVEHAVRALLRASDQRVALQREKELEAQGVERPEIVVEELDDLVVADTPKPKKRLSAAAAGPEAAGAGGAAAEPHAAV